jgi:heptosyltransferase-3
MTDPEPLACLIAGRNLGDIVMWSGLLRELSAAGYARRYVVWTRPKMACLFEDVADCDIVCSSFPVGTGHRFGSREIIGMLRAAAELRWRKPSVVIDFVGDFRERLLARLIGGRHRHIGWEAGHRYNHMIRNPIGAGHPFITVPARVPNIYDGYRLMLEALIGRPLPAGPPAQRRPIHRIGLHPFASQPSKLWPAEHWQLLARELLGRGFELWAFSSPEEHPALARVLAGLTDQIVLRSTDIHQYCLDVSQLDLVIGLDSLCMHTAHRFGVPSLTINAGNPPDLYAVPSGQTLAASGGCRHYPCFNIAPCRGSAYENACVKAILPQRVLDAVAALQVASEQRAARSAG